MFLSTRRGKDPVKTKEELAPSIEEANLLPNGSVDANQTAKDAFLNVWNSARSDKRSPSMMLRRKLIQLSMQDGHQRDKISVQHRLDLYKFRKMNENPADTLKSKKMRALVKNTAMRSAGRKNTSNSKADLKGRSWLIDPSGTFKKIWETFKFCLLIYTFIYLPMKVTFFADQQEEYTDFTYIFDKFIDFVFLIDLILNFFTPLLDKYDYVTTHKSIAKLYLRGWFTIDLITLIPFDEIFSFFLEESSSLTVFVSLIKIARLTRLIKLVRLFKSFDLKNNDNYIIEFLLIVLKDSTLLLMLPNFLLIVFAVHVYSCVYYFLGDQNLDNTGWIAINKLNDWSDLEKYIVTFYFVIQTFSTVGYGDILSNIVVLNELGFRMVIVVSGVLIFSLFSGTMVDYRNAKIQADELFDLKQRKLKHLVKKYQLPMNLYYNIIERLKTPPPPPKTYDFSQLNHEDLETLDYTMFVSKFDGVGLFSERIEDHDFVINLGRACKKILFSKDQIIFEKGEPAVMFFIILKGEVQYESTSFEGIELMKIKKGYFGEYEIIENQNRFFTARAIKDSVIYTVHSTDFKKLFITTADVKFSQKFIQFAKDRHDTIKELDDSLENFFLRKLFWRKIFKNSKKKQNKKAIEGLIGPNGNGLKPRRSGRQKSTIFIKKKTAPRNSIEEE